MTNILAPIKEAIKSLTTLIKETSAALYAEANVRKEKLAAAVHDMNEVNAQMKEFAGMLDDLADIVPICGDMEVASEFVTEMLSDMNVFETNVESFNGYCDGCGIEMTDNDECHCTENDEFVCTSCWEEMTAVDEDESVEQLTIPIEEKSE